MRHLYILFVGLICFGCWGTGDKIYKFHGSEKISHTISKGILGGPPVAALRIIGFTTDSTTIKLSSVPQNQYHYKSIGIVGRIDTTIFMSNFYANKLKIEYIPTATESGKSYLYVDAAFRYNYFK